MPIPFSGAAVALVTPFREDLSVHYELFEDLIEDQLQNETAAVVVCGTTGEGATLSVRERAELFRRAAAKVNGRVPVTSSRLTLPVLGAVGIVGSGCASSPANDALLMSSSSSPSFCDGSVGAERSESSERTPGCDGA